MITFATSPRPPFLKGLSRLRWAAVGIGLLWVAGCSSSTDDGNACAKHPGQCGRSCSTDTDCAMGLYCGQSGKCAADCSTNGASCGSGLLCDSRGRCAPGAIFGPGTGIGTGLTDASACLADTRQGEGLPVDIYIMNDQSQSMTCAIPTGGDRWTAMTTALTNFVKSPALPGSASASSTSGKSPVAWASATTGRTAATPPSISRRTWRSRRCPATRRRSSPRWQPSTVDVHAHARRDRRSAGTRQDVGRGSS